MRLLLCLAVVLSAVYVLALPSSAEQIEDELMSGIDPTDGLTQEEAAGLGAFDSRVSVSFWDRTGALLRSAVEASGLLTIRSGLKSAAILLTASMLGSLTTENPSINRGVELACELVVVSACTGDLHQMIGLGVETVNRIRHYALALIPGLCSLAAAAGASGTAAALRLGTAAVLNVMPGLCIDLLVPMIYLFVGLSAAEAALGLGTLEKLRDLTRWICVTLLKWTSSALTGLLALTGCLSDAADAGKIKAARMVISGMIPMVGGAVSNASESLMNAAELLKASLGAYGMLAVLAIFLSPFLKIGFQYLVLKFSGALSGLFGARAVTGMIERLTQAMGLVLAMTGVICMMTLLSFALCVHAVAG